MNEINSYFDQSFPTSNPQKFVPKIISTYQHKQSSPTISIDEYSNFIFMIFSLSLNPADLS